jgi:cytochrome b6-f complex iron-sulfur subunit
MESRFNTLIRQAPFQNKKTKQKMDRKKFLKTSCSLCGIGVIGIALFLESCKKTSTTPEGPSVNFTLDLTQTANSSLNTTGGSLASNGVVIVNEGAGSFIAIAQSCTHNGCSVAYNQSGNNFVCPCHGGTFDTNGKVTSGPPPAPLKKYSVTKNGNILTVSG